MYSITGYAYHADLYCVAHGEALPEIDPVGNPRDYFTEDAEFGSVQNCCQCGVRLETRVIVCDLAEGEKFPHHNWDACQGADVCEWSPCPNAGMHSRHPEAECGGADVCRWSPDPPGTKLPL